MFYKISKAQAQTLGKFEYAKNQMFDPFAGEQSDGYYLVSETMYEALKNSAAFKKLDWGSLSKISDTQLNPKLPDSK